MFDDFDGPAGTLPAQWKPRLSVAADFSNAHTDYPRNASLDGDSHLVITAIRETVKDPRVNRSVRYTTATLQSSVVEQYGTWSARILMAAGDGHHPTFMLWGADYNDKTMPWPDCGEIDVMELQDTIQGVSIHGPGYNYKTRPPSQISTAAPFDVRGAWHTYWCRHEENRITVGVDDETIRVFTPADLPAGKTWVFNKPLFAALDLSIGTRTNPDTQPFPVSMLIDYVSHTPLEDAMYRTKDQVAQEFIAEGKRRGVTARGIVICIATGLVESNLVVYANSKVPESLQLPHDAVGSDGMSVGPLQQQVVKGSNGQWWWGDAQTCMDPTKSAGLFYDRLVKLDYNGPGTPGSYAQAIQQSAYPDRYDQRMADAQKYYDRLSGVPAVPDNPNRPAYNAFSNWTKNQSSRNGAAVDCVFVHTNEPAATPSMNFVNDGALNLSNFIKSTEGGANPVSYHTVASQNLNDKGVTVVYCADTDNESWSVGNSNPRSLNYCFGGSFSGWTTAQWMQQSGAIDAIAWEIVSDCIKYGLTTKDKRPPVDWSTNYAHNPPVISDHRYCSIKLRDGNNHTDVDNGRGTFPWKYFENRINEYTDIQLGIAHDTPTPEAPPVTQPKPVGPADDQVTLRWNCLGGQTLVEALAEVRDKVLGTNDRGKPGAK